MPRSSLIAILAKILLGLLGPPREALKIGRGTKGLVIGTATLQGTPWMGAQFNARLCQAR
jgi:hypothetical protein